MTRRETFVLLLEWYPDVLEGLREPAPRSDDPLPLMCRAWNHPTYQQLERLLVRLRSEEPGVYWHVRERYITVDTVRVLECPACKPGSHQVAPQTKHFAQDGSVKLMHKHGGRHVLLVPRAAKRWSRAVRPELVDAGLAWLEAQWRGHGPFLPDELLPQAA